MLAYEHPNLAVFKKDPGSSPGPQQEVEGTLPVKANPDPYTHRLLRSPNPLTATLHRTLE